MIHCARRRRKQYQFPAGLVQNGVGGRYIIPGRKSSGRLRYGLTEHRFSYWLWAGFGHMKRPRSSGQPIMRVLWIIYLFNIKKIYYSYFINIFLLFWYRRADIIIPTKGEMELWKFSVWSTKKVAWPRQPAHITWHTVLLSGIFSACLRNGA